MAPFLPSPSSMWSFQFPHHLCAQHFPASRSLTPFLATLPRPPPLLIGDLGSAGSAKRFGAVLPIPFPFNFLRTLLCTRKTQPLLFQEFPHSLPKTARVGYPYSATPLPHDVERGQRLGFLSFLASS